MDQLIDLLRGADWNVAAFATLIASIVAAVTAAVVALINAWAASRLDRRRAQREYRLRQTTALVEFGEGRLRAVRALRHQMAETPEFDSMRAAVAMVADDHVHLPALSSMGDGGVQETFELFRDASRAFMNTVRICDDDTTRARQLLNDAEQLLLDTVAALRIQTDRWVFGPSPLWFWRRRRRVRRTIVRKLQALDDALHAHAQRPDV